MGVAYHHDSGRETVRWLLDQGVPVDPPLGRPVYGLVELAQHGATWQKSELLDRVRWALEQGASPNRRALTVHNADAPARTVFQDIMKERFTLGHAHRAQLLELFLAHGGDPVLTLSPTERCVWDVLLQEKENAVEWRHRKAAWEMSQALPPPGTQKRARL